jgi:hypothetical protein
LKFPFGEELGGDGGENEKDKQDGKRGKRLNGFLVSGFMGEVMEGFLVMRGRD